MSINKLNDILNKLKIKKYSHAIIKYDYSTIIRNDYSLEHIDIFNKRFICNYKNKDYLICHYKSKIITNNIDYIKHEISIQINNYIPNEICDLSPIIHITIYKDNIAYLKHISYFNNRTITLFNYNEDGIHLFETCLQYLKENKDELNINEIHVFDNGIFYNKNKLIPLSFYYTLVHGETFYNKYGFIYIDDYYLKSNVHNKQIIEETKICNTTLFKYIFKVIKNRKNRIDFYNKFSNLTIKEFFNKFHDECFIEIFNDNGLYIFLIDIGITDLENKWMKLLI